jgi:hypothetical protein
MQHYGRSRCGWVNQIDGSELGITGMVINVYINSADVQCSQPMDVGRVHRDNQVLSSRELRLNQISPRQELPLLWHSLVKYRPDLLPLLF